ncbi:hypothetical protein EHE22_16600 [Ochrobactrum pseudogrignonense]|uniref:Uncharacterized protein n=2 Tax=Brucella/Ochrobactrum group TaxID=2826938 RepID=A0A7Y3TAA0_9HYPH|nr:hypothetical protein [Brucella pseudogrignonensis]NNV22037.1 hypothetical protein [Brucella pseudogrignonensis]
MTNRIVSEKEFRDDFRRHAETVCDFSQKKNRHILGVGSRQMNIDVGVEIIDAMITAFDGAGRTLDRKMVELHTPKGKRRYVSSQLGQMAQEAAVHGANDIESLWRTFGTLITVARKKRMCVYVAKVGATDMEWASVGNLKAGKTAAAIKRNEDIQTILAKGRAALNGRNTGQAYAEDCAEYFQKTI